MSPDRLASRPAIASAAVVVAAVAVSALATFLLCNDHFFYSLDDPYISLALGSQISHGHYGLNAGEFSSPSSSILYPFLLAAFARFPGFAWVPLVLNAAAAAATAACFAWTLAHHATLRGPRELRRSAYLAVSLCLGTGIVGVVSTGLEHSIHVFLCVVIIFGLGRVFEGEETPKWLIASIVLAPLFRFEGLALSCLAIISLAAVGRSRTALIALILLACAAAVYMLGTIELGLPLLPSSVLVKATVFTPGATHGNPVYAFVATALSRVAQYRPARLLGLLAAGVLLRPILRALKIIPLEKAGTLPPRREALLIFVVVGTLGAQVLFGSWGWWFRYEVYALATGAAALIVLWRVELGAFVTRATGLQLTLVLAAFALVSLQYLRATLDNPLAGRGIYEQQYQMRRFAVDFYRQPVAVNDIGWVSFRNPRYVLDLWGLGSEAARVDRLITHPPDWMETLAREHGIHLAMIYPEWFGAQIPASWVRVATLRSSHPVVTSAGDEVAFYATSAASIPDILSALRRFDRALGGAAVVYLDLNPRDVRSLARIPP